MKTIIFILIFAIAGMAETCQDLYDRMFKTLKTQKTTICRVTNIGEDREDILGFFFEFTAGTEKIPAVMIYGNDYPEMVYVAEDWVVQNAKCIENDQFRSIKTIMTPEQILNKLFSFKKCEENFKFRHTASAGKYML